MYAINIYKWSKFRITVSPSAQQFQATSRHVDDHEVFQNLYVYDFAHTIIIVKHGRRDLPKSQGTWFFFFFFFFFFGGGGGGGGRQILATFNYNTRFEVWLMSSKPKWI